MKQRLFTPGPTPVPHAVRAAMAAPMVHHRDPVFLPILDRVRAGLKQVFQTAEPVLLLSGTGTAAMEAAVVNHLAPGDLAIYVDGGKFGARWGEILQAYGIRSHAICVPWGHSVDAAAVACALDAHPEAKAVFVTACETSTGADHPVREIAALCATRADCLAIVDGITAVAISDLPMDAWGIDVLLGASQKSFMMPPGLAMVAMSAKAWSRAQGPCSPRYYCDLRRERQAQDLGQTAWTSSVSLIAGLDVALSMMLTEGMAHVYARHTALAEQCRAQAQSLGCTLYPQVPTVGLTAVRPPQGVDARAVISQLQSEHGMRVGGGQGEAAGRILRLAHMGYQDTYEVAAMMTALGRVLGT